MHLALWVWECSKHEIGEPYGDYIFGRMVKTGCKFDETSMTVVDRQPTADYQSWVRQYPSYEALLSAAISSIEKDETPATSPVDFDELIQAAEYLSKVEPPRIVPLDINTLDQMFEAK